MSSIIKVLLIISFVLNTFSIPVFYPESTNNNDAQFNKRNGIELNIGLDLNDIPALGVTTKTIPTEMNSESSSSSTLSLSYDSSEEVESSAKTIPSITKSVPTSSSESTKTIPNVIVDSNDQQTESAKTVSGVIIDGNDQQPVNESSEIINVKTIQISLSQPSPTPVNGIPVYENTSEGEEEVEEEKEEIFSVDNVKEKDEDIINVNNVEEKDEDIINIENVEEEEEEDDDSVVNSLNEIIENSDNEEEFEAEIEHNCEQNSEECNDHILNSSDVEFSNDEIDTSNVEINTETDSNVEVTDAAPYADTIPDSEVPELSEEEMNIALVNDVDSADEDNTEDLSVNANVLHDENSNETPSSPIEVNIPSDIPVLPLSTPAAPTIPTAPTAATAPTAPTASTAPTTSTTQTAPAAPTIPSTSENKIDDGINIGIDVPLLNGLGIDLPGSNNDDKKSENSTENNNVSNEDTEQKESNENINEGPIEAPDLKSSNDFTQSEYEEYLNDVDDNIKNLLSFESGEDNTF